jgi:hypothetical protein
MGLESPQCRPFPYVNSKNNGLPEQTAAGSHLQPDHAWHPWPNAAWIARQAGQLPAAFQRLAQDRTRRRERRRGSTPTRSGHRPGPGPRDRQRLAAAPTGRPRDQLRQGTQPRQRDQPGQARRRRTPPQTSRCPRPIAANPGRPGQRPAATRWALAAVPSGLRLPCVLPIVLSPARHET